MSCRPARSRSPAPAANCWRIPKSGRPIWRADTDGDFRDDLAGLSRPHPGAVRRGGLDGGSGAGRELAAVLASHPLLHAAGGGKSLLRLGTFQRRAVVFLGIYPGNGDLLPAGGDRVPDDANTQDGGPISLALRAGLSLRLARAQTSLT